MEDVFAELMLIELVRRGMNMGGDKPNGPDIHLLCAVSQAGHFDTLEHALAK